MNKIILASKSPRRKEILSQVGIRYEVIVSNKDEIITKEMPCDIVMELSKQKALDVKNQIDIDSYTIIAADTVVAVDDKILGKPKDRTDAFNMIKAIQGREHSVYTGVTLINMTNKGEEVKSFYEETKVEVYPMTDSMIEDYLNGYHSNYESNSVDVKTDVIEEYHKDWEDKAGAYGIQGEFASYVKSIKGDYYTVVGLPISRILYELRNWNN